MQDLIRMAAGQTPLRITKQVERQTSSYRSWGIDKNIYFSDGSTSYTLLYPTKFLRDGGVYEFIVLPKSQMILDYHEVDR
jgi:hypothetical protein